MRRETVYRVSVLLSVIGLTVMYSVDSFMKPDKAKIEDLDESMTGEHVTVEGDVESFNTGHGHLFIDLNDGSGEIDVVDFDSDVWIESDDRIEVRGYIDIYEGDLQLVAEEIR